MKPIFFKANTIIETLEQKGFEAYFVGGSIRDYILKRPIGDVDIATSALPTDVMQVFEKTIPVGLQHGTVVVNLDNESYEVTTFRTDEEYTDYRRPSAVKFVNSLKDDLKRRDFTMNAIAMDREGNIIDPFHGQLAIQNKIIQTVGNPHDRFKEDALRMMRALRFQSQLSFEIEEKTFAAIGSHASLLKHVSIERITIEFEKLLMGASCQKAIHLLVQSGLSNYILNLKEYEDSLLGWPNLDFTSLKNKSELWAIVCLLLKIQDPTSFLKQWKLPSKVIKEATMIKDGVQENQLFGWTPFHMYKLGEEVTLSVERVNSILLDLSIEKRLAIVKTEYNRLPIKSKKELTITGHDLVKWANKPPGPWIAETILAIEKVIVNGTIENKVEKIRWWLEQCNRL